MQRWTTRTLSKATFKSWLRQAQKTDFDDEAKVNFSFYCLFDSRTNVRVCEIFNKTWCYWKLLRWDIMFICVFVQGNLKFPLNALYWKTGFSWHAQFFVLADSEPRYDTWLLCEHCISAVPSNFYRIRSIVFHFGLTTSGVMSLLIIYQSHWERKFRLTACDWKHVQSKLFGILYPYEIPRQLCPFRRHDA